MSRAVDGTRRTRRRRKILKQAKGFWGRRSTNLRVAKDSVAKALSYAYRDRKAKKREFRQLWISRISAACRGQGITYSRFVNGLLKANINLNRKVLSCLAIDDKDVFSALVVRSKEALGDIR
jgi:large subunit ribosomal protein L20